MSSKPVLADSPRGRLMLFAALVVVGICLISWGWRHRKSSRPPRPPASAATNGAPGLTNRNVLTAPNAPRQAIANPAFQSRPLAVTRENDDFQWTGEDGKDPAVIQKLAHNDLEFERMVGENDRIFKRQLVYHRDTVAAQVERAKLTGEPLHELQLPGLDGREIRFQITSSDLNPSGQQGNFSGRIAGQADSMVTFAFKGGREAFTVLSPEEDLYLLGEPREPGEFIVKSIDITNYSGVGGEPRTPGLGN